MSTNSALVGTVGKSIFASDSALGNNNAGFHNSVYRGKGLGTSVTAEQFAEITAGTFNDMFLGDYWTIGSNKYVICHFDYYYKCNGVSYHHIFVMPHNGTKGILGLSLTAADGESISDGKFKWNTSGTTSGGYIGSRMRTAIMPACDNRVKADFGSSHVLAIPELYPNAFESNSGVPTSWGWVSTQLACDLPNEVMIYGTTAFTAVPKWEIGIDKWQLAICKFDPFFVNIGATWWLRSVTSASRAAYVDATGNANDTAASGALVVRPRFLVS